MNFSESKMFYWTESVPVPEHTLMNCQIRRQERLVTCPHFDSELARFYHPGVLERPHGQLRIIDRYGNSLRSTSTEYVVISDEPRHSRSRHTVSQPSGIRLVLGLELRQS